MDIFNKLADYQPLLAGTIPLDIAIASSDLDIICRCKNHIEFTEKLQKCYGQEPSFTIKLKELNGISTTIAKFEGQKFKIEIVGQNIPSEKQQAFRHVLVEHHILEQKGTRFKQQIIALKKAGIKTEPAFAALLGLTGDPYKALLKITI